MKPVAYLHFKPGLFIYVGPSATTKTHEHHAIQLVLGLDSPILFENEIGLVQMGYGFLIGKDYQHHCKIEGEENALLLINIDPEHKDSQFWNATLLDGQPYIPIAEPYLSTLQNLAKAVIRQEIPIMTLSTYLEQLVIIEKDLEIDTRI